MAYWVKILHEKKEYVVNFERVTSFCHEQNGRITFWLPDIAIPIIINPQTNLTDHQKILEYIQRMTNLGCENDYWVNIPYEKKQYIINLTSISSFCQEPNGRITFWLPDSTIPIIVNPVSNPHTHEKVLNYIHQSTGYSFSEQEL